MEERAMGRRTAVFAVISSLLMLTTAACGHGGSKSLAAHQDKSTSGTEVGTPAGSTSTTQPTTATTRSGGTSSNKTTAGAPGQPKASPGSTTTPTTSIIIMPPWFTIRTDKACVHANETQGFTVKGGDPGQLLIYDTEYANGTNNATTHYGTGNGNGKFDSTGTFHMTFVLAGNVPPGTTYMHTDSSHHGQIIQARTTFVIKPITQPCP
jgi:hypothetical protein